MRKNKLIHLLQEINGNPEILVWNGYVGDWMGLEPKIHQKFLSRMSKKKRLYYVNLERELSGLDMLSIDDLAKDDEEWSLTSERGYDSSYHDQTKKVYMLEPKTRGMETFDRIGKMEY